MSDILQLIYTLLAVSRVTVFTRSCMTTTLSAAFDSILQQVSTIASSFYAGTLVYRISSGPQFETDWPAFSDNVIKALHRPILPH